MKKILFAISIILLLIAVSCSSTKIPEKLLAYEEYSTNYVIPKDGKLHFYFMASKGMKMENADEEKDKWGDSCLIVLPDGQTMLVDAAMSDYAPLLALNLMKMGVEKIDYLVITHPHNDHAAGIYNKTNTILQYFTVGQCYYTGIYNSGWDNIHMLEDMLDKYGVPRQVLKKGDSLDIGGVHFTIINPPAEDVGKTFSSTPDINNSSLVFRMDYGSFSALFTGDIYMVREWELVKEFGDVLDVDLLKIPHHGHNTSSTTEFGAATSPKVAVATGHAVIDTTNYMNYTRTGSRVYMDYLDDYIHVWSDGTGVDWETSKVRTVKKYNAYEAEAFL